MAFQWHPDRNRDKPTEEKEATEKFQQISAAYKRLTDVSPHIVPPEISFRFFEIVVTLQTNNPFRGPSNLQIRIAPATVMTPSIFPVVARKKISRTGKWTTTEECHLTQVISSFALGRYAQSHCYWKGARFYVCVFVFVRAGVRACAQLRVLGCVRVCAREAGWVGVSVL
jgi:hypothetical protein